jgi:hypothetical protein
MMGTHKGHPYNCNNSMYMVGHYYIIVIFLFYNSKFTIQHLFQSPVFNLSAFLPYCLMPYAFLPISSTASGAVLHAQQVSQNRHGSVPDHSFLHLLLFLKFYYMKYRPCILNLSAVNRNPQQQKRT